MDSYSNPLFGFEDALEDGGEGREAEGEEERGEDVLPPPRMFQIHLDVVAQSDEGSEAGNPMEAARVGARRRRGTAGRPRRSGSVRGRRGVARRERVGAALVMEEVVEDAVEELGFIVVPPDEGDGMTERDQGEEEEEHEGFVDISSSEGMEREGSNSLATSRGNEFNEIDPSSLPNCPVCMDKWTLEGIHRVCCIPCGHVYGRSCLERWVQQCGRTSAKCPQCSRGFKKKEIINLYAPPVTIVNEDLEKEVRLLREKNEALNLEKRRLLEEVLEHKKKACLNQVSGGALQMKPNTNEWCPTQSSTETNFVSQKYGRSGSLRCCFALQTELDVDGARVLGIDASSQILVISRKTSGRGDHVLTKISLLAPYEMENVHLPCNTGAIKDLQFSPSSAILPSRLVLLASLGKKLSVFSMESNNIVLKYELPGPAWSCSWDINSPHHIYAGLQNGMLLVFDIRQTASPVKSIGGLSGNPLHTIYSPVNNGVHSAHTLLTASSVGPCLWDVSGVGGRPSLIPDMENQGVCISLASGFSSDDIVATFRPKVEISTDAMGCQPSQSSSPTVTGTGKLGTHVLAKSVDGNCYQKREFTFGIVSEVRMSRSAIIGVERNDALFVYGDEAYRGVCVWDLPSFQVVHRLKPHQDPIIDIKYERCSGPGLLGCISENRLQVFTCFEP